MTGQPKLFTLLPSVVKEVIESVHLIDPILIADIRFDFPSDDCDHYGLPTVTHLPDGVTLPLLTLPFVVEYASGVEEEDSKFSAWLLELSNIAMSHMGPWKGESVESNRKSLMDFIRRFLKIEVLLANRLYLATLLALFIKHATYDSLPIPPAAAEARLRAILTPRASESAGPTPLIRDK